MTKEAKGSNFIPAGKGSPRQTVNKSEVIHIYTVFLRKYPNKIEKILENCEKELSILTRNV